MFGAAALFAAGALSGCGAFGGHLQSARRSAGAEGEVRFRRVSGNDVAIDLAVKHMKEPERLDPPAWAYVAWVRGSREEPAMNVGMISVAKDRTGELKAVTQLRRFEFFVTAEPSATVEEPSGEPLLWTNRYE